MDTQIIKFKDLPKCFLDDEKLAYETQITKMLPNSKRLGIKNYADYFAHWVKGGFHISDQARDMFDQMDKASMDIAFTNCTYLRAPDDYSISNQEYVENHNALLLNKFEVYITIYHQVGNFSFVMNKNLDLCLEWIYKDVRRASSIFDYVPQLADLSDEVPLETRRAFYEKFIGNWKSAKTVERMLKEEREREKLHWPTMAEIMDKMEAERERPKIPSRAAAAARAMAMQNQKE